jgi:hypothetical protein
MLQLVEGCVLLIEQLPVPLKHLIVDHPGERHTDLPSWNPIGKAYPRAA